MCQKHDSLEGKVAAVTGGASGIGLASTKRMLEEGARVVVVDQNEAALAKLNEEYGDRIGQSHRPK